MNDQNPHLQNRYAAHLGLAAIGETGQQRISASRIGLIGLGGLGCATAQYLVSSGIGHLVLCDFDTVAESNLARQILYRTEDIGHYKAEAAASALSALNPTTKIDVIKSRMDTEQLTALANDNDLLIDASDNYGTRLAVNNACIDSGTPWLMGSAIRMEGQVVLLQPQRAGEPCYRCIYGKAPETLEDCPGAGIFAPVAGMIGTAMAHRALCYLAGIEDPGELNILDGLRNQWQQLKTGKNPGCPACGTVI
jgi:adenylyltransferase/sulfurtransferase